MEVLVCQECEHIITYLENGKSGVLYGKCSSCQEREELKVDKSSGEHVA